MLTKSFGTSLRYPRVARLATEQPTLDLAAHSHLRATLARTGSGAWSAPRVDQQGLYESTPLVDDLVGEVQQRDTRRDHDDAT